MLFRGALAIFGLAFVLAMLVASGQVSTTRAITPGECLDPRRGNPDFDNINSGNAVSIWNWTATGGQSGKFTAVQSHSSPPTLDILSISGLLNQAWSGLGIGVGTDTGRIFLIESGKSASGFTFAAPIKGTTNPFAGFAVGGPFFIASWNATSRLLCVDNEVPVPHFEITDEDIQDEADDPPVGWTAPGWNPDNDGVACTVPDDPGDPGCLDDLVDPSNPSFSGSRALRSQGDVNECGEHEPNGNYWVSPDLDLGAEDYVVGVFTRSSNATSRAEFGIVIRDLFFGTFLEYREASTRTSTTWGLSFGVVDLSDVATFLTTEHLVLHADFTSCSGTSIVYFDDAFVYPNTGVTP
jgi:hypothetical protein